MTKKPTEIWDLAYPKAAATGLPFSRGRIDAQEVILVHAAPEVLTVQVYSADGSLKAQGEDLRMNAETPITRLTCRGGTIEREDIWPDESSLGLIVLLPGGEAGVLKSWWHAPDHSEWRWTVEFKNHR